ncbi:TolC family protein [Pyxidicoccus fallax]|uniref:TolC family protein n=1 Tax=Pyxidicoccus fallax TaxID=394095 RepID=A0A848LCG8_9BACT|nr:TolC family protein [Pyxidicoccus fallax]NMO16659.1 TolC family protein [Pyxidicoccus fallax]NPC84864.1 TolC family protein [Pyxidicoccus fallax]
MKTSTLSRWKRPAAGTLLASALALGGCVTVPLASDARDVHTTLGARWTPGVPVSALSGEVSRQDTDTEVRTLLSQPLTADSAVRVALLNNREVRAAMHDLGVATGNLVQASLPPNPEVELELRKPTEGDDPVQADIGLEYDLSELILLPLRRGAAQAERSAERARTAGTVLELAYRTRLAFLEVQARQQQLELRNRALQSAQAGYGTAVELEKAGNIPALTLANERSAVESARLAVAESESALLDAREALNVLLGLFGPDTAWTVAAPLADPAEVQEPGEGLEARAIEASLDLAELRGRMESADRRHQLARTEGLLPHLSGGFHGERDEDRWELGAHLTVGLPVFDRKQGERMAALSSRESLKARYEATATAIRSSLRQARGRVESTARRARHVRDVLLPARTRALDETVLQYNAMQVGVFEVLRAQAAVTDAASTYVETSLEHHRARSALEQLLAGRHQGLELGPSRVSVTTNASAAAPADAH